MTSLAFTLGVVPLYLAVGAGAEMRIALGTAVFWGMIGVTLFGLVFTPVFYVVVRQLRREPATRGEAAAGPPRSRRSSGSFLVAALLQPPAARDRPRPADQKTASMPLCLMMCNSRPAGPLGLSSPRSHLLRVPVDTSRRRANTAWLMLAASRMATISRGVGGLLVLSESSPVPDHAW